MRLSALVIAWRVQQCVRSVIRSQLKKSWELLPSLSPLPNSPSVSAAAEKNCKAPKSRHAILFADCFNRNLSANRNPLFLWLPATPLATSLRLDWRGLRVLCSCLPSSPNNKALPLLLRSVKGFKTYIATKRP